MCEVLFYKKYITTQIVFYSHHTISNLFGHENAHQVAVATVVLSLLRFYASFVEFRNIY